MLLCQFALGAYHFRLNPDTEFKTFSYRIFSQIIYSARQFLFIDLPVSQTDLIRITGILISEPSVIKHEHFNTESSGVIDHIRNRFFIKIEISAFPAIQDDRQFLISMGQCIVTRPVVQISRYLSFTGRTICPDHFRSLQRFTRFQIISRGKIIHPAHDVQQTAFVNLKGRQIVTRPGQGAGIHFAHVFIGRAIQGKQERRVFRLGSTYPLLGFHPFYTRCQLFFYQLHFGSPGPVEMGQIIRICMKGKISGGNILDSQLVFLLMGYGD